MRYNDSMNECTKLKIVKRIDGLDVGLIGCVRLTEYGRFCKFGNTDKPENWIKFVIKHGYAKPVIKCQN